MERDLERWNCRKLLLTLCSTSVPKTLVSGTLTGMIIRPEKSEDVVPIHHVHSAAFPTDAEARLVDSLRASEKLSVSLVAELDGVTVGHIAFSPVSLQASDSNVLLGVGLAPVAVHPTHQRQGVGSRLIRAGLAKCKTIGCPLCVVLGEPAYYTRFGFSQASKRGLANEYGAEEAFMVCEFHDNGIPPAGGMIKYAPEFSELGGSDPE